MKLYADLPGRRTVQILADVGILAWVSLWAWVGRLVHDTTMEPPPRVDSARRRVRGSVTR